MQVVLSPVDQFASVATIGKDLLQSSKQFWLLGDGREQMLARMHILYIGGGHFGEHNQTQGVHQEVTLTSTHQFATIKTSFFTTFSTFHRLAVSDHGTGLRPATCFF